MNVNELIYELQHLVDDGHGTTEVSFAYSYGDYWNTIVCPGATCVEVGNAKFSDYHSMDALAEPGEGELRVVISNGSIVPIAEDYETQADPDRLQKMMAKLEKLKAELDL
jgi:hypothetical protein